MYASLAIDNSIELQGPRNVRQLSLSRVSEPDSCAGHEVAHRARDENLPGVCLGCDPRDLAGSRIPNLGRVHERKSPIYTPAMATTAVERKLLVGGEWVETGEWIEVRSPYDGELVGRVPEGGSPQARDALDAAEQAMREPLPAHERAAILDRVAALLSDRADEAARTISAEAGKPMKAARVEAARAVSTFTMAAVEARKLAGDVVPMDASPAGEGKLALTLRQPIGIVGAISPFNFPLNLVAHKIAPALAAGCAVVLKPAAKTPLSALLLAELEAEAGLPAGWLNVVCGPAAEIGDVLVEDERVKLITFTGSVPIGW